MRRLHHSLDLRAILPELALLAVLAAAPVLLPPLGFSHDLLSRALNWALFGLGLDILFGLAGLLSFGQAAFYGMGGFVAAYLLVSGTLQSVWLALLLGTAAAGVLGLAIGWLAVRRIGIYFAMITLAFGQMAYFIQNGPLSAYTGGENGIAGVPVPVLGFGAHAVRITGGLPMYAFLAAAFFLGFVLARRIARSPVGLILKAMKENSGRVAMLGHDVPAYKLAAFTIAALYGGLAGAMLGPFQSYMPPDAFALETSGQLVVQTIVGGVGTLVGPLVGAALWLWLRDNLQLIPGLGPLWKLVLGLAFIGLVMGLRRGICGEIRHRWRARRDAAASRAAQPRRAEIDAAGDAPAAEVALPIPRPAIDGRKAEAAIEAQGLARHYGGLKAVDGVSFRVRRGSIHAVIGPNGAGKSTLFKMLSDEVQPSAGAVLLFGVPLTGSGVSRAAQRGVAKSNQLNQLFLPLSVRENLRVAALARSRGRFRLDLLRPADGRPEVEAQVAAMLALLDLGERADTPASVLAYGEKRRLEIGMALATSPNVLLLDEPLAGMSPSERAATCALIRRIGRSCTVVLVEHDLDAVFGLAERITVLSEGRLLADGPSEEVRRDPAVQKAYLGAVQEDAAGMRESARERDHESLLEVEGIDTLYGDSHVLFDVSLRVEENEVVALLGRNGAGKTTTLRTLMGVLKPRTGTIRLAGRPIQGLPPARIARAGMQLVPEERAVFGGLTVEENLRVARLTADKPWPLDRIWEVFPRLKERRTSRGRTLSGGEQQMLSIARALIRDPTLLLLDEPFEGLAPLIVLDLVALTRRLAAEGRTIVIVEQNVSAVLSFADRVYGFTNGHVVYEGRAADLRADPAPMRGFMGLAA